MSDADVQLPPPPKADGRSREAREARRRATAEVQRDTVVATAPQPNEQRERPTRAEATRRERRRRNSNDKTGDFKLGYRFTPDPAYEYRWINNGIDGQRIYDKTVLDDWEMVNADGELSDNAGSALRRAVGESKSGPIYSYLCRKPKDWYEADHRKKQERNDKMMDAIRAGRPPLDISGRQGLTAKDHVYGQEDIVLEGDKPTR